MNKGTTLPYQTQINLDYQRTKRAIVELTGFIVYKNNPVIEILLQNSHHNDKKFY